MTVETKPVVSPLTEAKPNSLEELFSRDPLGYTRLDRNAIVAELRRMRAIWAASEAQGKPTRAKAGASAPPSDLNAGDLGL